MLRPAAEALGAAGPLPADTVFVRAMRGEFDAVLAPYHDVGMTAIKVAVVRPGGERDARPAVSADLAGSRDGARHRGAPGRRIASSMRAAIELRGEAGQAGRSSRSCFLNRAPAAISSEIRIELELLRRPVGHQHRPALQNGLPLHQPVRPERVPGIDQIHDPVRQVEQRRHLDRAVHLDDVDRPARARRSAPAQARILGGDARRDAARAAPDTARPRAPRRPAGRTRSPARAARARRRRSRAGRRCR